MSRIVLPSDFITDHPICVSTKVPKIIGHGLEKRADGVYAVMAGVLHETDHKMWLNSSTKRYTPHAGDRVLGTVVSKAGDFFRVDIGSADLAQLSFTAFEGATKRNRPNVRVGDLVYGQVLLTSKQLEPELSCVDSEGRARGMGVISAPGLCCSVPLCYARRLLATDERLLAALGRQLKFETTIGMNGMIWIGGDEPVVLAVRDAILAGETTFESNIPLLVQNTVQRAGSGDQSRLSLNNSNLMMARMPDDDQDDMEEGEMKEEEEEDDVEEEDLPNYPMHGAKGFGR